MRIGSVETKSSDDYIRLLEDALSDNRKLVKQLISAINLLRRRMHRKKSENIATSDDKVDEFASAEIRTTSEQAIASLRLHHRLIKDWSSSVYFSDSKRIKQTVDIYVELDTFVTPTRLHIDSSEKKNKIIIQEAVFSSQHHCVVTGQPGAGKTTAMKMMCLQLLKKENGADFNFPILIRLKELQQFSNTQDPLFDAISAVFDFEIEFSGLLTDLKEKEDIINLNRKSLVSLLNKLRLVLILEGFDEIPLFLKKERIFGDIQWLAHRLQKSKIVVTCRTGEFSYNLDKSRTYEIAPLSQEQITTFVSRWLDDCENASDFMSKLVRSPFADTAIKPLFLAHICALYERIGRIPEKPKTIYKKLVNLLLEEWDEQRFVKRESKYANFETDRKFDFLSHLAYDLTINAKSTIFNKSHFLDSYCRINENYGLARAQAATVVAELESHTGLFLQSGYDDFEFVHRSLQEYLAAEYIVRLPSIPLDPSIIKHLGHEMAISVSLSSNSTLYLSELWNGLLKYGIPGSDFFPAFINRLFLERPEFQVSEACAIYILDVLSLWLNKGVPATPEHWRVDFLIHDWSPYGGVLSLMPKYIIKSTVTKLYDVRTSVDMNKQELMMGFRRHEIRNRADIPTYILLPKQYIGNFLLQND